jgi:hypothetical protein
VFWLADCHGVEVDDETLESKLSHFTGRSLTHQPVLENCQTPAEQAFPHGL